MYGRGEQLGHGDTDIATQRALGSHTAYYPIVQTPSHTIPDLLTVLSSSFWAEVATYRFYHVNFVF
jgi:hypothetical protein